MPVVGGQTPTVQVSVPVPVAAPMTRRQPVQPSPPAAPQVLPPPPPMRLPQAIPGAGYPAPPAPTAFILPWRPAAKAPKKRKLLSRRIRFARPVRYAAGPGNVRLLLRAVRSHPYEDVVHGQLADALDEEYPGNVVAGLIRGHFGFAGDRRENLWYEPVENSWDGSFPYAARIGQHGPFDLYLRHEGSGGFSNVNAEGGEATGSNPRWVVHAVSRFPETRDTRYTFEFPHEEAHLIPRMFPEAEAYINKRNVSGFYGSVGGAPTYLAAPAYRRNEAADFNRLMDEQEANR